MGNKCDDFTKNANKLQLAMLFSKYQQHRQRKGNHADNPSGSEGWNHAACAKSLNNGQADI